MIDETEVLQAQKEDETQINFLFENIPVIIGVNQYLEYTIGEIK